VDWFFLDGFNSDKKFWIDSNGLEMVQKKINFRREYKIK
jgi:hypothetical protein